MKPFSWHDSSGFEQLESEINSIIIQLKTARQEILKWRTKNKIITTKTKFWDPFIENDVLNIDNAINSLMKVGKPPEPPPERENYYDWK